MAPNKRHGQNIRSARIFSVSPMGRAMIYRVLLFAFAIGSNTATADSLIFEKCKSKILESRPYGLNAIINKVSPIEKGEAVIYFWPALGGGDELYVTTPEGIKSVSVGECKYNKKAKEVVRLMIYGEYLITDNSEILNSIDKISSPIARDDYVKVAKLFGLTVDELFVLRRFGRSQKLGPADSHDERSMAALIGLQAKDWLRLVIDKNKMIHTFPTDISKALARKL